MKVRFVILTIVLMTLRAWAAVPTGDYVETRTASVFAGACHYGGEVESDGREAAMAWRFNGGDWHGVPLAGLSAVAVVRSDKNLADPNGHRTAVLFVDRAATGPPRTALVEALTSRCGQAFGKVAAVVPTEIRFERSKDGIFHVEASDAATLTVAPLPDRECCKQPNLVWYAPLVPLDDRRVGYTETASCTSRTGGDAWSRHGENSAFYGSFRL